MKTVNCFLFKDPVPTLVDCGEGTPAVWEALKSGLKDNGLTIKDIKRLFITHAHVDHIGSAARIAEETDAEIWVSNLTHDWAVNLEEMWGNRERLMMDTLSYFLGKQSYQNIAASFEAMATMVKNAWPPVPSSNIHVFQHEGIVELGGSTWQTLYMPGHSANQSCFFNPQNGFLLSADMLLKITPTPVIDTKPENHIERELSIFKLLESYQRIREYDITKVFPGHYEVFENPRQIIDHQVGRIHLRKEACMEVIRKGTTSFWEIGMAMYAHNLHLPAINMVVGYLDLLEAEGNIYYGEMTEQGIQILAA